MNPLNQRIGIALLTLSLVIAAGCDQSKTPETVGQKVDRGIEKSGEKMEAAGDSMKKQADKAGNAVDDATITTKVKSAFVAEPSLSALDISVETNKGVVTLTGTVGSSDASDRAKQIAAGIDGVTTVNNKLVVKKS